MRSIIIGLAALLATLPAVADDAPLSVRVELHESSLDDRGKVTSQRIRRQLELRLTMGRRAEFVSGQDVAIVEVQKRDDQVIQVVRYRPVGTTARLTARPSGARIQLSGQVEISEVVGEATHPLDSGIKNPVIAKRSVQFDLNLRPGKPLVLARLSGQGAVGQPIKLELRITVIGNGVEAAPKGLGDGIRLTGILYRAEAPGSASATLVVGARTLRVVGGQSFQHAGRTYEVARVHSDHVRLTSGKHALRLSLKR